jgi:hypothetical protein
LLELDVVLTLLCLQGKPQNVVPKLKQDLPDAIKVNWALWVPAQVCQYLLPHHDCSKTTDRDRTANGYMGVAVTCHFPCMSSQFINFQFVPPNLRVLAVNIVALVWNCYMSYQSHKAVVQPAVAIPAPAAVTKKGRK